ncbi:MAG: translation initiation factor IF-5A [Candidatus Heimdallarchaeota archaeon]|nr:translation initiation factor IF-5A [Candidatus Heimdallarchaeota archaeon]MCK5049196.1 translation initiation factor IF-5A [Candidatus Heimdallarchaeota archaeon]
MDVEPIPAGQIKVGTYIVHNGDIYRALSVEKSKTGKHGHAKVRMSIVNIQTNNKTSLVSPASDRFQKPIISKNIAQVLSLTEDSVQMMDMASYETFEVSFPVNEELKAKVVSGVEVEYWMALGRKWITEVRNK